MSEDVRIQRLRNRHHGHIALAAAQLQNLVHRREDRGLRADRRGTDIYADDSRICPAAVHAGLITSAGGTVTIKMQPSPSFFRGSVRNGVTTQDYGAFPSAFVFVTSPSAIGPTASSTVSLSSLLKRGIDAVIRGRVIPTPTPLDPASWLGTWYREGDRARPATVRLDGSDRVVFTNESGGSSTGHLVTTTTALAEQWEGGLRATLTNGGRRIEWANGSTWQR